ncbi:hypothetical protein B0T19DRAFT_476828 [Cercophora scortea]|uniref:Uncharacterized protein n=1 Tax=Cercophora scortea TaxID=314031 RepID=A0AAE0MAD3_9PEZI|nr:hypothetical protein B0T19DRAFT_476828 [Cercophora scortea]
MKKAFVESVIFLFIASATCRYLPFSLDSQDVVAVHTPPTEAQSESTQDTVTPSIDIHLTGPYPPGTHDSLELLAARRALKKLKDLLGPSALQTLLDDEIKAGYAAWHAIHASPASETDTDRVLAEVHITAIPHDCNLPAASNFNLPAASNFTALAFAGWFVDSAFNHREKLWEGHPEHYGVLTAPNADGTLRGEILEPWGPLMTYSVVPRLAPVGGPPAGGAGGVKKKPFMKPLEEFPLQMVGEETLMDGTGLVVGDLHYSWRDVPRRSGSSMGGGGTCGVEGVLAMWMAPGTPKGVVEGLRLHLAVEYYNWLRAAYGDVLSGAFKLI